MDHLLAHLDTGILSRFNADINDALQFEPTPHNVSTPISTQIFGDDDITASAKILLDALQNQFELSKQEPLFDDDTLIDPTLERERCHRYNLTYDGRLKRRRIFYGSLIADDSWENLATSALEHYGMLHSVVFVESNRTQSKFAREWRFGVESKNLHLLQKIFGFGDTKVNVEYFVNEDMRLELIQREHEQRALIVDRWKKNGMTMEDIGYIADIDETFTRDFLRAMQICQVEQFDNHGNCKNPKVRASSLVFEGGPQCLTQRFWNHPDLVLGECIDKINPSTKHFLGQRRTWEGIAPNAPLHLGYTSIWHFRKLPPDTTHYPLLKPSDFRNGPGTQYNLTQMNITYDYNGYHFHNFFSSIETLRTKYGTFGHPNRIAHRMQLHQINRDMASFTRCALDQSQDDRESLYPLVTGGGLKYMEERDGPLPLAFRVHGYVHTKMEELRTMGQLNLQKERNQRRIFVYLGAHCRTIEDYVQQELIHNNWEVYLWEPNPQMHAFLLNRYAETQQNNTRFHILPYAAGIEDGSIQLHLQKGQENITNLEQFPANNTCTNKNSRLSFNSVYESIKGVNYTSISVPQRNFPEWLSQFQLSTENMDRLQLKIDIVGAEYDILERMLSTKSENDDICFADVIEVEFYSHLFPKESEEYRKRQSLKETFKDRYEKKCGVQPKTSFLDIFSL
eukprot:CAMPEP_0184869862 /NCGR_PEP_ID=MMETSP0580-20130426/35606_1 /TAXON_ID=1118495 /ORGANISM="Dactyliosolen fragilissimus" /LENGTH=679 /DNA_ID=CAMNT_0027371637 /DNA_START=167 /DNA_END=2207 /DNA_ORIENTATION=-